MGEQCVLAADAVQELVCSCVRVCAGICGICVCLPDGDVDHVYTRLCCNLGA
jgi:hypothetical protein